MASGLGSTPITGDSDNRLLKKAVFALLGISPDGGAGSGGTGALGNRADAPAGVPATLQSESIVALLKAILNKNVTIDANGATLILELDEVEEGIGLKDSILSPKQIDPDLASSLIGYLRGVLEAANTIATASAGVSAVGTYTSTSATPGGAAYTALTAQVASSFRFVNNTGEILEFRTVAGAGPDEEVAIGAAIPYSCVANMSEWEGRKKAATAGALTITGAFEDS